MDDDSEVKKSKGTKKCVIKCGTMFKNYTYCLFDDKIILKLQQSLKATVTKCTQKLIKFIQVNKIALSSNDDKRLQKFDMTETYPYGINAFKVCKSEMIMVRDLFCKMCRLSVLW